LFEFIRQDDIKTLINYFVENFYSDFESITYVKTFHDLKLRHDAHRDQRERILSDSSPTSSTSRFHDNLTNSHFLSIQRLRKDERDLDVDEENWFNDDADENKITSLNHGTLFNNSSDDEDSQPEITSAISTSEPPRSHHTLLDNNDDDGLPTSSRSHYNKPVINIHIGRSSTTALPVDTSSPTSSQSIESSSPYAMSPALSNIADQYNDEDEDEDEENNSDSYSITNKRKFDDEHEQNKVFKRDSDQPQ